MIQTPAAQCDDQLVLADNRNAFTADFNSNVRQHKSINERLPSECAPIRCEYGFSNKAILSLILNLSLHVTHFPCQHAQWLSYYINWKMFLQKH